MSRVQTSLWASRSVVSLCCYCDLDRSGLHFIDETAFLLAPLKSNGHLFVLREVNLALGTPTSMIVILAARNQLTADTALTTIRTHTAGLMSIQFIRGDFPFADGALYIGPETAAGMSGELGGEEPFRT